MSQWKRYDISGLVEEAKKDPNVITIEATVVTGFEGAALDECKEKCNPIIMTKAQGRIIFNLLSTDFEKVLKLRAVDNLFFVNDTLGSIQLTKDKDKDLEIIKSLVNKVDWESTLSSWAKIVKFNGILFPKGISNEIDAPVDSELVDKLEGIELKTNELGETDINGVGSGDGADADEKPRRDSTSSDDSYYSADEELCTVPAHQAKVEDEKDGADDKVLKFRATCNRVGQHSFTSMEAAACFGGALHDKFNWTVNLNHFDLNVILNINSDNAYICSGITEKSLHRRNITHFGYTTLRSTLCYNMVRLAEPINGEIVVDPLCGGGSIPIEGALGFPTTFHICGDNNDKAMKRTNANICHIKENEEQLLVDPVCWSARKLPLKDSSVDICVTDLPFGRRSGKKSDNLPLYRDVLREMGRISRCGQARAVLLTHDKKSFTKALFSGENNTYWRQIRTLTVNQGGLFSTVFLLLRTAKPFTHL